MFFSKDGLSIKGSTEVDMPVNKETKLNQVDYFLKMAVNRHQRFHLLINIDIQDQNDTFGKNKCFFFCCSTLFPIGLPLILWILDLTLLP